MKGIVFLLMFAPLLVSAQPGLLILKKRGKQVHLYVTGSEISMRTIYGVSYDGYITNLKNDSVFINGFPFHVNEIAGLFSTRKTSGYLMAGTAMMIAAAGIVALGPINGIYRGDKPKDYYSKPGLITAAALGLAGFGLRKSYYLKYRIGKKYSLQYLNLN